ncbi:MAG: hypothetical protein RMK89_10795 [Armatimonadota bacterium]|nr:hypothetical protein [Armatimonadota bacterium]MDW8143936.1 hypothetical protein [Armatimonadota bacterium]
MKMNYDEQHKGWHFETEELKGFLLPEGQRHGVKTLVHKPTGVDFVHSQYDVLNLFLLFSTNHCMGTAREKGRTVRQIANNAIEVHWAPTNEHKAELTAIYQIKEPNIVDLTITVKAHWIYPAYELFLSNYFDPSMRPHVYVQGSPYPDLPNQPQWIAPLVNDVFLETGLVFPRDQHAARLSVDGRWDRIWALYQWNPQHYYAKPIALQTDTEKRIAAVLMSRPKDCFAVVSGYHSDNLNDPFKGQNPLYLSLFGDDLVIGSERTAYVRLQVTALDEDMQKPLELYDNFMVEVQPL